MAETITLDELTRIATRAGLNLSEEDLRKLLPGVIRSHKQVADLRDLLSDACEPAGIFYAAKASRG